MEQEREVWRLNKTVSQLEAIGIPYKIEVFSGFECESFAAKKSAYVPKLHKHFAGPDNPQFPDGNHRL